MPLAYSAFNCPLADLPSMQVKTVHHPVKRLRPVRFLLAK
jgi:hypothetical protein